MKEIETLPGDSFGDVLDRAMKFILDNKESITFAFNEVRIIIIPETYNNPIEIKQREGFESTEYVYGLYPRDLEKRMDFFRESIKWHERLSKK